MRKKSRKLENAPSIPASTVSGTRDAVESAIDLSKGDRSITWEESAANNLARINRWESPKKNPGNVLSPSA
jgi:hypothetical protein